MATKDTGQGASGLSRRDFLKASAAATAVVGCGLEFAYDPAKAAAYEADPTKYQITSTTCPYCSASCGQRVVVDKRAGATQGQVIDMYGDFESPMNSGGLCAKGAGTIQLVTNPRRLGAWAGAHPVKNMDGVTADNIFAYDAAYDSASTDEGVAYKRTGNGNWSKVALPLALADIATKMKAARETDAILWNPAAAKYNSKGVAFFGSSHVNNEPNYLYRKLIADFGTSNVEHQARI